MRLICPKCDAQYNVADDAIPDGGRDVQCSTCGHTWFQTEKSRLLQRPTSRVLSRPLPNAIRSETGEDSRPAPQAAPQAPAPNRSRDVSAFDVPHHHKEKSVAHEPLHRPIDPTVAGILQQEAARENRVPRPQTPPAARRPQPDEPARSAMASLKNIEDTRKRIAEMAERNATEPAGDRGPAAAVTAANPRAVPELHEINAVLQAREEEAQSGTLTEAERVEAIRRRGFRRGFFVVLLIFALIITPYILADQIVEKLPQSQETMTKYVLVIDALRITLNATINGIMDSIRALTGQG